MNIGAKHSLCLISMLSNTQPSESMPMKNSLAGLKSRRTCAGSDITIQSQSNRVCARGHITTTTRPVGVEELAARLVKPFVGVRPEIVALGLQEVGGQALGAV